MSLTHSSQGSVLIVELPERLVMASAPQVRNELKELIGSQSAKLILDLRKLEFVDSSGLSVMISSLHAANEANGDVVLLAPSKQVRALIELTRLHNVFQIFDELDAAVSAFG